MRLDPRLAARLAVIALLTYLAVQLFRTVDAWPVIDAQAQRARFTAVH